MPNGSHAKPADGRWVECTRGVVIPAECDHNDHLTVSAYLPKFEEGTYYLFVLAGVQVFDLPARGLSTVSMTHTMQYTGELRAGDPYVITAVITRLGRSSVTYAMKMINPVTGKLAATCTGVDAMFSLEQRRTVEMPDDIRSALDTLTVELTEAEAAELGLRPDHR